MNDMIAAMAEVMRSLRERQGPERIFVSPVYLAIMRAEIEFRGRDWRRVKREVRKAADAARKRERAAGRPTNEGVVPAWRVNA